MDTLFADISEWQPPLDDSYPYRVLSIRSNDGTHRDDNFAHNYDLATEWLDQGRLEVLIVYVVIRQNWQDCVRTHVQMQGDDRPGVVSMVDAESWNGRIAGDNSEAFNGAVRQLSVWRAGPGAGQLDRPRRVIGYLNPNDAAIWPSRPRMRWIVPAYGALPRFGPDTVDLADGMIAHQYTDGSGYGGGLPEGYGDVRCDMNSADGASVRMFAQQLGV
ncbi:hypothetical protein [Tsukamurella sp. NPDC003166]|uniref:hypothetical protein n=1 Tax=Tsukamurella sp. NPDC003166 TaxID=3154444 RepID=UPI0033A1D285